MRVSHKPQLWMQVFVASIFKLSISISREQHNRYGCHWIQRQSSLQANSHSKKKETGFAKFLFTFFSAMLRNWAQMEWWNSCRQCHAKEGHYRTREVVTISAGQRGLEVKLWQSYGWILSPYQCFRSRWQTMNWMRAWLLSRAFCPWYTPSHEKLKPGESQQAPDGGADPGEFFVCMRRSAYSASKQQQHLSIHG